MKRRRMSCPDQTRFENCAGVGTVRGARNSENHFSTVTCGGEQEIACWKKVKFSGSEKEESSSSRDGGFCENEVDIVTRRSDQPKTAEYAYFQKLKEGGVHRFHHPLSHVERNQPEIYDVMDGSNKGSHSSMLTENVIAPALNTSFKKAGSGMFPTLTASPNIFSKLKSMEEINTAPKMKDVFSRKRENLLHQLRCTMSPEFEGLSLER
ncbi:hypothetical protein SAY86_022138 [Trapa natans]|uniref:Uncharacterized protein n=1 Tax=Trapa natans TaxID=22666 RepID=A0AAN7MWF6_TRANT|nr:hypothetical protein SAY86_022138 [Trapa natans]